MQVFRRFRHRRVGGVGRLPRQTEVEMVQSYGATTLGR
jgi:hypothetical protein